MCEKGKKIDEEKNRRGRYCTSRKQAAIKRENNVNKRAKKCKMNEW